MATVNSQRVAFSPKEFSALFGKEQTWGYRQIYAGKVKTVTEYGRIMIPASEVERILGKAEEYTGRKAKTPKRVQRRDLWKDYLAAKRKKLSEASRKLVASHGKFRGKTADRAAAIARLTGDRKS